MSYIEKLIQDYKQFYVKKGICVSKSVERQLSLEEPCVVIWEDIQANIRFSPYYEFIKYQKECSKLINILEDSDKLNDIYFALVYSNEDYENLLNELNYIINRPNTLSMK